jgi:hypothetical protein
MKPAYDHHPHTCKCRGPRHSCISKYWQWIWIDVVIYSRAYDDKMTVRFNVALEVRVLVAIIDLLLLLYQLLAIKAEGTLKGIKNEYLLVILGLLHFRRIMYFYASQVPF